MIEKVRAQHLGERRQDVLAAEQDGEGGRAFALVDRANAVDDRLLGAKITVEIAGAHAGFFGDLLHRRGVKAMADESALRGGDDLFAPVAFGRVLER
jgi:hypothetical protein